MVNSSESVIFLTETADRPLMRVITFDIETANWFGNGATEPSELEIALVGMHDSSTDSYDSYLVHELNRLWKVMEGADLLVGYNSDHFDIPLLNKYYPGDLTKIPSVDLMKEIYETLGRRVRLDAVADGTLGKKKSGHGGQSLVWWRNGEVDKVRKYCLKDVELTKNLYDYALKNGHLKYRELGGLHEVKLNTSNWHTPKSAGMTYTLGL
jgi:DEAD/DEAH box helicase domain-containing protein